MDNENNGSAGWGLSPRKVRGGIRAHSVRGSFGKNWWARRWIAAMEQLLSAPRLMRGKFYARQGQVISIDEDKEGITALVQGSRPKPYRVTIRLTHLTNAQWNKVLNVLADQAIFAAQLLAGEMPANIEEAFATAGVSLFPQTHYDLVTTCSCPDKANPCKHIAAVHYILGERFDEDPFLLFRMRGRSQEQILTSLRSRRANGDAVSPRAGAEERPPARMIEEPTRLEEHIERYWQVPADVREFSVQVRAPEIPQPLLRRLGEPDFVSDLTLQSQLEDVYNAITQFALLMAYGDAAAQPAEDDD